MIKLCEFLVYKMFNRSVLNIKYFHILLLFLLLNKSPVQAFSIIKTTEIYLLQKECTFRYDASLKRKIYSSVDTYPEFPGGTGEMYKYFSKSSKLTNEDYERFGRLEIKLLIAANGKATFLGFGNKNSNSVKYLENRIRKAFDTMPFWSSPNVMAKKCQSGI